MKLLDSSVLIDLQDTSSPFHAWATETVSSAVLSDGASLNVIGLAESAVHSQASAVIAMCRDLGINVLDLPCSAAGPAAKAFALYLSRRKTSGKASASKIPLPDFFIGAHAEAEGFALITRDPSRIAKYFPAVKLITP